MLCVFQDEAPKAGHLMFVEKWTFLIQSATILTTSPNLADVALAVTDGLGGQIVAC